MKNSIFFIINILVSLVWLINGLVCKILNFAPRHQQIVGNILGDEHSLVLTKTIGFFEVLMTVWVISKIKSKWCAIFQITIILVMNIIEFIKVPQLLLYGKTNIILAVIFCLIIFINEFVLNPTKAK